MKYTNISSKTKRLKDLFSDDNSYIVPGYQRPYEWSEKQIKTLLDNLVDCYNRENDYSGNNDNSIYLMGTIQFNIKDGNKEIIDGHQRITTLYLIKKFFNSEPQFTYKNEINNAESISTLIENEKIYKSNYEYIRKYFMDSEFFKKLNEQETENFSSFLDNNIVFVTITIEGCPSIADALEVFDTLNTAGLKLEVKDIFKIRFSQYLNKDNNPNCFSQINKAYEAVTSPFQENPCENSEIYNLSEEDLLDTYKIFTLSKTKKHAYAAEFKQSNTKFFEDYFDDQSNKYEYKLDLNDFCGIADCIKETQILLQKRDEKILDKEGLINSCSREFTIESGYSKLKNLYYYLIFIQYEKAGKEEVSDEMIQKADDLMTSVWKYCSVYRFEYSRIIDHVFNKVGEIVFKNNIDDLFSKASKELIDDIKNCDWCNFNEFKNLLTNKGNVKDCHKPHLLVILSYIDDSDKIKSVFDIKRDTFYRTHFNADKRRKWDLDIEHILSHSLYSKEKDVNSIGNLMYLTLNTNRSLGDYTKNLKDNEELSDEKRREMDFSNKISKYINDAEKLVCVKKFLEDYKNDGGFIEERNRKKCEFLKKFYQYDNLFGDKQPQQNEEIENII